MNRLLITAFLLLVGFCVMQAQNGQNPKWCETTIIIPAEYDTTYEQVKTKEAWTEYLCVPAVYHPQTFTRTIKGKTTEKKWKWINGKKVICDVEIPAETEQYTVQVLVTPASTQIVQHPAQYSNRKVIKQIKASEVRTVMVDCNEVTQLINSQ